MMFLDVVILSLISAIAATPFIWNGGLFNLFVTMYNMGTIKSTSSNNVHPCARKRIGRRGKHRKRLNRRGKHKRLSMKRLLDRIATSHEKLYNHYPFISDILIEMLGIYLWLISVLGNVFYNFLISICDISVSFVVRIKKPLADAVMTTILINFLFRLIDGCDVLMYAFQMIIFLKFVYVVNDFEFLRAR
jgi:hypothetical protein